MTIAELVQACAWGSANWLIVSDNVFAPLIYYSHLGPLIVSLVIGIFVLLNNPRALKNRILFSISIFFSLWVYSDLVLWASEKPDYIMFFWKVLAPIEFLVYASTAYLVAVFAHGNRDVPVQHKIAMLFLFLPVVLFAHTSLNLLGFDYTDCDREAIEGPLWQYLYLIEIFIVGWVISVGVAGYRRLKVPAERSQLAIVTVGAVIFLLAFSIGNILITYFFELDWSLEQYKLFGMPIFVVLIAYSIVRFKSFDAKILTSQVLVTGLAIATLSLLFLRQISTVRVIAAITFLLVCLIGFVLVRNVRREVEQREEIQFLAENLKKANEKLKELDKLKSQFLSIASHDLRAPLTVIRNFMALLLDGTYGKLPQSAEEGMRQVFDRATGMAQSIDTYLNVSRIEQGKMQYNFDKADIVKLVSDTAALFKQNADKKGLGFTFRGPSDLKPIIVKADVSKLQEVFNNLMDNAIKYTSRGTVSVALEKMGSVVRVSVSDTGHGMSKDTIDNKLFKLFSTAEESLKQNASSTGMGLYITRTHVVAHGGKIWAESAGPDRGSTFVIELPIIS